MGLKGIKYSDIADSLELAYKDGNLDESDLLQIGKLIVDLSQKEKWCNKYGSWCKHVEEQHYEKEIDCDMNCGMCKHCEKIKY